MTKNILYCGSQSSSRQELLKQAGIPFKVVALSVEESEAEPTGTLADQVLFLAKYKHIGVDVPGLILAHEESKSPIYILTADTMIQGVADGVIYGKPQDVVHAAAMLRAVARQEIRIVTGMCLSVWKYHVEEEGWYNATYDAWVSESNASFIVPDTAIDEYLAECPWALRACAGTAVEGRGQRYFKSLHGSYTGALGLDIFSLWQRLQAQGF